MLRLHVFVTGLPFILILRLFFNLPGLFSNPGQLYALLATQMAMWNASGAVVLASLYLVTICSVKCHLETQAVSSALERVPYAALIVKEQAIVRSGWESLLFPSLLLAKSNVSTDFLNC